MSTIRRATPKDSSEVVALLRALHGESVFRGITIDEPRLNAFVAFCISHPSHVCILHENQKDSAIDGMILGYVTPYFFSSELGAWDLAVYVRPERRGTIVAHRLWREFKKWATQSEARVMWLGTSAGIAPARTRKFYTGLGMTEVGALYRLALATPSTRAP